MSGAQFTKGPWAISPQGGSIAAHPTVTLANGEKRWTTTRICSFSSSGNIEANAHLIAAAPDLYEALDEALDALVMASCENVGADEQLEAQRRLVRAEAALRKARGETA